jgi:hypothetical protein
LPIPIQREGIVPDVYYAPLTHELEAIQLLGRCSPQSPAAFLSLGKGKYQSAAAFCPGSGLNQEESRNFLLIRSGFMCFFSAIQAIPKLP